MARQFPAGCNPADNPEACGLELLELHQKDGLFYEFDEVYLFRDIATGREYWVADSGCSCPSPLQNVHGIDDMEELALTRELYEKEKARVLRGRSYGEDEC